MTKNTKILAVIPARSGSKGIPQKNKVIVNQQPLIFHTIQKAKSIPSISDVCVTTDDEEILSISKFFEINPIIRKPQLCLDNVPLAPVLFDAVEIMEKKKGISYDIVILLQPTNPTIKISTISKALSKILIDSQHDTYISAKEIRHLFWLKGKDNAGNEKYHLFQKARVNRQQLNPLFFETGAFFITRRRNITQNSFIGPNIHMFPISDSETIDIDTREDLASVNALMKLKTIIFCVIGSSQTGLGHIFRCLSLARWLSSHKLIFITTKEDNLAIEIIRKQNYSLKIIDKWDDIDVELDKFSFDLIINDRLDTTFPYMKKISTQKLRNPDLKIINFEDLGDGVDLADYIINALYETTINKKNHYFGYKFVCLKEMFRYLPQRQISAVNRILVTFGGTDPNDLTSKVIPWLAEIIENDHPNLKVTIVIGPGYNHERILHIKEKIKIFNEKAEIFNFKQDLKEMALEMYNHDLIISSNGRTVYESISLGIPVISIAQNEREEKHLFSEFAPCVKYLGRYMESKKSRFSDIISEFLDNPDYLHKQNQIAFKFGEEIRNGIKKIIKLIEFGE